MDGHVVPVRAFYDTGPEISKHIPMMIGSVSEEGYGCRSMPQPRLEWLATLTKTYGAGKGRPGLSRK